MKIALAQINPTVGALEKNREKIIEVLKKAKKLEADLVVFSELGMIGYPPRDLLQSPSFIDEAEKSLELLAPHTKGMAVIIGTIRRHLLRAEKALCNTAAIFEDGKLIGFQDKSLLPEYDVFYERRFFEPGISRKLWTIKGLKCAVTICEDIWQHGGKAVEANYPIDPVEEYAALKPDLFINISASPYFINRLEDRHDLAKKVVQSCQCPFFYCNQVGANDNLIFDGGSFAINAKGELILQACSFEEDFQLIDLKKPLSPFAMHDEGIDALFKALALGVKDYFRKQGFEKAIVGVSGGIDSAVVTCIAKEALGKENVTALYMPSRYNPQESENDARRLAANLEIRFEIIPIQEPFEVMQKTLSTPFHEKFNSLTLENLQSRIRGMMLMAFSNQEKGSLVLNTGNKSELAVGYCTLYGDMCGALGVLNDVVKGNVYLLAKWINSKKSVIPLSIIEKEPSAELAFDQKDTDTLPPYSVLDAIIGDYVEKHLSIEKIAQNRKFSKELVESVVKNIHASEYKRRQAPPGLRVTRKAFSVGRWVPIVQGWIL